MHRCPVNQKKKPALIQLKVPLKKLKKTNTLLLIFSDAH